MFLISVNGICRMRKSIQSKRSIIPLVDHERVEIKDNFSMVVEETHGLFSIELMSIIHAVTPLDNDIDVPFIEAVRSYIESGHPDVAKAWYRVWQSTWVPGCTVETADGRFSVVSIDKESRLAKLDDDAQTPVPLLYLRRVFMPGEHIVVALGPHAGRGAYVLRHADDNTVNLLLTVNHALTNQSEIINITSACTSPTLLSHIDCRS